MGGEKEVIQELPDWIKGDITELNDKIDLLKRSKKSLALRIDVLEAIVKDAVLRSQIEVDEETGVMSLKR